MDYRIRKLAPYISKYARQLRNIGLRGVAVVDDPGVREIVGRYCNRMKIHSVLIITNKQLVRDEILDSVLNSLNDEGIVHDVYDGVHPGLTMQMVEAAAAMGSKINAEGVIAIGGRAALDCGKMTAAALNAKLLPPDMLKSRLLSFIAGQKPLIEIPVTAGSGAEMTLESTITEEGMRSISRADFFDSDGRLVLLDHEVMEHLSKEQMALAGIEALSNGLEALLSSVCVNDHRLNDMYKGICMCMKNLRKACREPADMEARHNMLKAANLCGRASELESHGYAQAYAHALEVVYCMTHGRALAVTLPEYLRFVQEICADKLEDLAIECGFGSEDREPEDNVQAFINGVEMLISSVGLDVHCRELRESDYSRIIALASNEALRYPLPAVMSTEESVEFLNSISEGLEVKPEDIEEEVNSLEAIFLSSSNRDLLEFGGVSICAAAVSVWVLHGIHKKRTERKERKSIKKGKHRKKKR